MSKVKRTPVYSDPPRMDMDGEWLPEYYIIESRPLPEWQRQAIEEEVAAIARPIWAAYDKEQACSSPKSQRRGPGHSKSGRPSSKKRTSKKKRGASTRSRARTAR